MGNFPPLVVVDTWKFLISNKPMHRPFSNSPVLFALTRHTFHWTSLGTGGITTSFKRTVQLNYPDYGSQSLHFPSVFDFQRMGTLWLSNHIITRPPHNERPSRPNVNATTS